MKAPRLIIPLELEAQERVSDGMGGFVQGWKRVGRVWAEMRAGSGGEQSYGLGAQSVVVWRITVRAARGGDPRRPGAGQRLSLGAGAARRSFRIEAVAETDPGQRYLICYAKEEVAA